MTLENFYPSLKNHMAVRICALFFLLSTSAWAQADNAQQTPDAEPPKIKINFAPGYKKTSLDESSAKDTYRRALHREIPKDTAPEQYREIAEPVCLQYPPKAREKYFIILFQEGKNAQVASYDCSEFEGATLPDTSKK